MTVTAEARKWLAQQRNAHQIVKGVILRCLQESAIPTHIHLSSDLFSEIKTSAHKLLGDQLDSNINTLLVSLGTHEVKLIHAKDFAEKTVWAEVE